MPRAFTGTYSPDGRRIAYEDVAVAFAAEWAQEQSSQWRHYRGGTHASDPRDRRSPTTRSTSCRGPTATTPRRCGSATPCISSPIATRTTNLFSYEPRTKQVAQLTRHDDFDIMSASAGPDAIVYEQAGYDSSRRHRDAEAAAARHRSRRPIFRGRVPSSRRSPAMIRSAVLSPTGVRAAFEARGDIFTVPAEKGDARNLTQSSGVHDRSPVWSPDGTQIAWLSDASGEYQLMIGEQTGADQAARDRAAVEGVLLGAGVVARRQAAAARGQSSQPVDDRHRERRGIEARHRHLRRSGTTVRRGVVAGLTWVAYSKSLDEPPARDLSLLGRRARRRIRSPTDCRTRSRRRSTPAASISTFWRAPTTRCGRAGWR